jgi:hypothetical protein
MSRRHHGGRHRHSGHGRSQSPLAPSQTPPQQPRHGQTPNAQTPHPPASHHEPEPPPPGIAQQSPPLAQASHPDAAHPSQIGLDRQPHPDASPSGRDGAARDVAPAMNGAPAGNLSAGCTAPQLRRFIKSRPYVPMHELRRRFGINGAEDDVTVIEVDGSRVYVGLPTREGGLLGELLRGGEVGYELSLDPRSPIVVGLYPMRPVPRG